MVKKINLFSAAEIVILAQAFAMKFRKQLHRKYVIYYIVVAFKLEGIMFRRIRVKDAGPKHKAKGEGQSGGRLIAHK
jgi:hypothetical protein